MRSSRPIFVVDASVAVKWHLRDEDLTANADSLLLAFRETRVSLLAPECFRYEVANAIRKTVRTRRMTSDLARRSIAAFLDLEVPTVSHDLLLLTAFDQAMRFGCSLFDGMYLALAEASNCQLIHADARLRNALGTRFPRAIWLEELVV